MKRRFARTILCSAVVVLPIPAIAQYRNLLPSPAPTDLPPEGVASCIPGFRDKAVERRNGLSYRIAHSGGYRSNGGNPVFVLYAARVGTCRIVWKAYQDSIADLADFDSAAPSGYVAVEWVTVPMTTTHTVVFDASSGAQMLSREVGAIAYYGKTLIGISGSPAAFAFDPPTGGVLVCNLTMHEDCASLALKPVPYELAGATNMNFSLVGGRFVYEFSPNRPPSVEGCYSVADLAHRRVREVSLIHC
jgi:hypothetical protein